MMQLQMAKSGHECLTPNHRWVGQVSFTIDETVQNIKVARHRVLIENAIKSVKEYKKIGQVIKVFAINVCAVFPVPVLYDFLSISIYYPNITIFQITNCDLAGSEFFVAAMLCNYKPPLRRGGASPLSGTLQPRCMSLWGWEY